MSPGTRRRANQIAPVPCVPGAALAPARASRRATTGCHLRLSSAEAHGAAPNRAAAPGTSLAQTSPDGPVTSVSVPPLRHNVGLMNLADWAEHIARDILETSLPRRWAHSQGVASQARSLARILGRNAVLLEAAAWLHDIGYAPGLAVTGFHQLDGGLYLRDDCAGAGHVVPTCCPSFLRHHRG